MLKMDEDAIKEYLCELEENPGSEIDDSDDDNLYLDMNEDLDTDNCITTENGVHNIFWNFWRNIQQRTIFNLMSTSGIMIFMVMTMSINVAIVAMVKGESTNSSSTNVTSVSDVCPISAEDQIDTSTSESETGDFDWDEMTQGYILSASNYGSIASALIGARIAELWSPKMVYGIANAISAICNALIPIAAKWSVESLITIRVLEGIAKGSIFSVYSIFLAVWIPPHDRTKIAGYYYTAGTCGYIFSTFLTGILITAFGWESIFYIFSVVLIIWSFLWFILIYDTPETHPRISPEEREYILSTVPKENHVTYPVPWVAILTSGPFWAEAAMDCGNMWIVYIILTEIPTYLNNILHYNIENTGYVSALVWVASLIGTIGFVALSHWLQKREYMKIITVYRIFNGLASVGPAVGFIIINLIGCDSTSIIVLLVLTNGLNAAYVGGSINNLIALGINFTGTTNGICYMASLSMGIISPMITSAIINDNQTLSSWSLVFYISAAVSVLPFLIFLIFGSAEEQYWNKPAVDQEVLSVHAEDDESCK